MSSHDFSKVHDTLFKSIGPDGVAPGCVLLVRLNEEIVFHGSYGYRQLVPRVLRITEDTLFDLASLTKSVGTALAAMQVWGEGNIDLEGTLAHYLPGVHGTGKESVTIRDLLAHTSGLPAWRPYFREVVREPDMIAPAEVLRRVLHEPLDAPAGKLQIYSDLGFILLGWILESIAGETLDRVFSRLVFNPLGLFDTGFRRATCETVERHGGRCRDDTRPIAATEMCRWRGRILIGEVHDENCHVMGRVAGHAGLFSTAGELDRILREIVRGYHGSSKVFAVEGIRTFFTRQQIVNGGTWALGWDTPSPSGSSTGRYFSKNSFGHNGFTGTSVWMDFERGVSVVFLTNRVHPSRERQGIKQLRPAIHDAIMESLGFCGVQS